MCCFERLDLTCRAPPREERSIIGLGELLDDAAFNLFTREIVPDNTQKMLDDDRPTIEIYELLPTIGAEKPPNNSVNSSGCPLPEQVAFESKVETGFSF